MHVSVSLTCIALLTLLFLARLNSPTASSSDDDEPLLRHGRARSGYASYIASLSSQQRAEGKLIF